MKNIIKKELNSIEHTIKDDFFQDSNHKRNSLVLPSSYIKKVEEGNLEPIIFTKNKIIKSFFYKNIYILPEPDPIIIMFNSATLAILHINTSKDKILAKCTNDTNNTAINLDNLMHEIYNFYSLSFLFITSVFNAYEGAINRAIPEDFIYKPTQYKKYSKIDIQKNLTIINKINKVLPEALNNSPIETLYPSDYLTFLEIKNLRNEITHLKTKQGTTYETLLQKLLDLNYNKTLESFKRLINHYHDNLLELHDSN